MSLNQINMIKKTLLTIGIPIFNGEKAIEQTLQSILDAKKRIKEDSIEILISDNCSDDKTIFKIKNFMKRNGLLINININSSNLGYDKNVDKIVEQSNSPFVWFLGCGERIAPDSIRIITEEIQNNMDLTNIVLNFDIYNESNKKFSRKELKLDENIFIFGGENFSLERYSSAMSANIVSKTKWLEASNNSLHVEGWCHVERISEMILKKNSASLVIKESCFTLYRESKGWWFHPRAHEIVMNHLEVIKNLSKKYEKNINIFTEFIRLRDNSRSFLLSSILYRRVNQESFTLIEREKIFQKLKNEFKMDKLFLFSHYILMNSPKKMVTFFSYIVKVLKQIKNISINHFN